MTETPVVSRLRLTQNGYRLVLGGFTVAHLGLIWLVRFLPMVDLPQHLSFVAINHNYQLPASGYQAMFQLRFYPTHNILHLLITSVLARVVDIETANRLFLSGYIILLPLAVHYLIRTVGGNRWLVPVSLLFVYNFNFFWGFVSSTFAIPLVLMLLALTIRQLSQPRLNIGSLAVIALLAVLIFLGHSLFYLLTLILSVVLIFSGQTRRLRFVRIGLLGAQLPAVLFFVIPWQLSTFSGEGQDLVSRVLEGFTITGLLERVNSFFITVGARADELTLFTLKLYFVVAVTAAVLYARRSGIRSLFSGRLRPIALLTITSFAAFLLFPGAIRQAWFLNERFTVFGFLFLTVLLSLLFSPETGATSNPVSGTERTTTAGQFRKWALAALLITLSLNLVNLGYRFLRFDTEARPVAELLTGLPKDRKIVGLIYETKTTPDLLGYDFFLHFANYYQVWNRGYPGFSFASIRFSPIQYRDPTNFLPPGFEWSPSEYIFPDNWQTYDYFLVHGPVLPQDQPYLNRLSLIRQKGDWLLYAHPGS